MALDLNSHEYRAFIETVQKGRTEEAEQRLTEHPEFLHLADCYGMTPLHFAAENENESIVKLLLQAGCHFDALTTDEFGWTPLYLAAWNGNELIVKLLLQAGCHIDAPAKDGMTTLHLAAGNGNESIAKLLLQTGCNFNALTKDGRTPLHFAVRYGRNSIAKLLKAVGACVSKFDRLFPLQIKMIQELIPEEEIVEIRFAIYFEFSLLDRLLFLV